MTESTPPNPNHNPNPNLIAVSNSTIEGIGHLASFFGFSEVMGRLYGALLMSPEPLSLDELAERLEISKGSVSMNMRSIERWGMAKEVWMRGERRKFYVAESDMWKVIRNILSGREMREVQRALQVLGESAEKLRQAETSLSPQEQALAAYYLERLADLQAFFQLADMALQTVVATEEGLDFEAISRIELA
jgi:HTH-type transcriptional regulator, glycine betaine synthesis regulator